MLRVFWMTPIGVIIGLLLAWIAPAFGQLDTTWVVRNKPPDRTVIMLLKGPLRIVYRGDRMSIQAVNIYRDSLGSVVYGERDWRITGADTMRVEIRYTTADSIPSDYGIFYYRMVDSKFVRGR